MRHRRLFGWRQAELRGCSEQELLANIKGFVIFVEEKNDKGREFYSEQEIVLLKTEKGCDRK